MKKIFTFLFAFFIIVFPYISSAAIVPACGQVQGGNFVQVCDFNQFMKLINNVIEFLLFKVGVPIVAIIFCYAGFLMISPSNVEHRKKVNHMLTNVVIGYVIALAAWLVVNTILKTLNFTGADVFLNR